MSQGTGGSETSTVTSPFPEERAYRTSWYLSIFEPHSSRIVELPEIGELIIGRGGAEGHVNLEQPDVSREHARLLLQIGGIHIVDAASHNGTYLNGRRLRPGPCRLSPYDEIRIGNVKLLVTRIRSERVGERTAPQQLTLEQMVSVGRRTLHDEIRSAADRKDPLALICWVAESQPAHAKLWLVLQELLGTKDVIASDGNTIICAMPDHDVDMGLALAAQALERYGHTAAQLQAGCASYPLHAVDAEGLLWAAREAADSAPRGAVQSASGLLNELLIGEARILIGDGAMRETRDLIRRISPSSLSVLVTGESGTGKEWAATALHAWSDRATKPFVTLNCTAVTPSLFESELFGHVRGAFSGAIKNRQGLFQEASGGTLFLDEVGDMPLDMQAKFLRALETQRIRRVGENIERQIDVRIVAATNHDLDAATKQGRFRLDLFHRLCASSVRLPALRERVLELPALAQRMLNEKRNARGARPMTLSTEAVLLLRAYGWPGNVRELKNVMHQAAYEASPDESELLDCHLPVKIREGTGPLPAERVEEEAAAPKSEHAVSFRPLKEEVRELERRRIREALAQTGGEKTAAARLLHMPLRTFYHKLKDAIDSAEPRRS